MTAVPARAVLAIVEELQRPPPAAGALDLFEIEVKLPGGVRETRRYWMPPGSTPDSGYGWGNAAMQEAWQLRLVETFQADNGRLRAVLRPTTPEIETTTAWLKQQAQAELDGDRNAGR